MDEKLSQAEERPAKGTFQDTAAAASAKEAALILLHTVHYIQKRTRFLPQHTAYRKSTNLLPPPCPHLSKMHGSSLSHTHTLLLTLTALEKKFRTNHTSSKDFFPGGRRHKCYTTSTLKTAKQTAATLKKEVTIGCCWVLNDGTTTTRRNTR